MGTSPLIFTSSSASLAVGQAGDGTRTGLVSLASVVALSALGLSGASPGMVLPQLTRDDTGVADFVRAPQVYAGGGFNGY